MDRPAVIISMPKNSTKEDMLNMRNKYKDQYIVNIIISGDENPQENIKKFLINRLEK